MLLSQIIEVGKGKREENSLHPLQQKQMCVVSKPHETGTFNEYEAGKRKCMHGFFKSSKGNYSDMYFFC